VRASDISYQALVPSADCGAASSCRFVLLLPIATVQVAGREDPDLDGTFCLSSEFAHSSEKLRGWRATKRWESICSGCFRVSLQRVNMHCGNTLTAVIVFCAGSARAACQPSADMAGTTDGHVPQAPRMCVPASPRF
jgi:hypothetical protein